jgi:hypothetical protein
MTDSSMKLLSQPRQFTVWLLSRPFKVSWRMSSVFVYKDTQNYRPAS